MNEVRAAIDIGTNSFHLLIARLLDGGGFEIITREKENVRLGHGAGEMSRLEPDAIERGVQALARFRRVIDAYPGARVKAVATSAVREAANRDQFLSRARDEAGIDVEVISGVEEARLIHRGVVQAIPVHDRTHLVVDIGGGSTEFVVAKGDELLLARSLKLGAIRLTDRFFPGGIVRARDVKDCREFVRAYLTPLARDVARQPTDLAIVSSGTALAIATMLEVGRGRGVARWLNNVKVPRRELADLIDKLVSARTPEARLLAVPGLDERRADIIVGGALLLEQIMDTLRLDEVIASEYALREGVLLDEHVPPGDGFHRLDDIRRSGVQRVVERFERDRPHVEHATDLALRIFDELQPLHGLDEAARDHLEAAGMLHNVGLFVSHSAHHKHSYYVIRNTDQLVGFTDHELEIIALVARYHRKSSPSPKHVEFAALHEDDQRLVRTLAGLLRVAIALDRTHRRLVDDVSCTIWPDRVVIRTIARPEVDVSLELYTANQRRDLLAESLGRAVEIVDTPPAKR